MLKTKNKTLYIVLAILAGALIFNTIRTNLKGERSFRKEMTEFDANKVNKFIINNDNMEITFTKKNDNWSVSQDEILYKADQTTVLNILKELSNLKVEQLVAKEKSKWNDLEVEEEKGTKVTVYTNNKMVANLVVGRFKYRQTGNGGIQLSTMVRLSDETEVYSVEGSLSMSINRNLDAFRDKTITKIEPEQIQQIKFSYPGDSSFVLSKNNDTWLINSDSATTSSVMNYLSDIKECRGNAFATEFNADEFPFYTLELIQKEGESITVNAYIKEEKYIFKSTQNEGIISDSETIFKRLFASANKFGKE